MTLKKEDIKLFFLLLFLLIPYFFPEYLYRYFPLASTFFDVWKIISISFSLIHMIGKKMLTKHFVFFSLFNFLLLFLTILNDGNVYQCLGYVLGIETLCVAVQIGLKNKYLLLKVLEICFFIPILMNFVTIILYPNGLYTTLTTNRNWLLGYDNTHVQFFLPAFVISILNLHLKNKLKLLSIAQITIILLSVFICQSTTTIVGMSVISILSFVPFFRKKYHIFNFKNYMLLSFILFFFIVIFRWQEVFENFIVGVLGKDLTFTNRTILWDITLDYFYDKPILGHGWQDFAIRSNMYYKPSIVSAHNQFLEWLYLGGVVYLGFFVFLCIYISKNTTKNRDNGVVQIIHSGFFVLLILWLTECYLNPVVFLVLILSLYANEFKEGEFDNE